MVRCLMGAIGLILVQSAVSAEDKARGLGSSPCLILLHDVDKASGSLVFHQVKFIAVQKAELVVMNVDGKTKISKVPYTQYVERIDQLRFSIKDARIFDRSATQLNQAEVLRRARPGMAMVIARWGDKLNLDYLLVLKKDTLFLVLPADWEVPMPELRPTCTTLLKALQLLADVEAEFILQPLLVVLRRIA